MTPDVAARLAAASPTTIRGWVRRGSVRSRVTDGETELSLHDVVTRALARRRPAGDDALGLQLDAALGQLEAVARQLADVDDQYARREAWARGQHEREMRDVYALWEQERSQWEQERRLLEAVAADVSTSLPLPANGHVTSRPPVSDDRLPPLPARPRLEPPPSGDITPSGRPRVRWRRT